MNQFGLIGKTLSHSWSGDYFTSKWQREGIQDREYLLLELEKLENISELWKTHPKLKGLNITIPYKESIRQYLNGETTIASEIGAVNCIKRLDDQWFGHNTDGPAFLNTLSTFIPNNYSSKALILGKGGSAKAVSWALEQLNIPFQYVCRCPHDGDLDYGALDNNWDAAWEFIINCTPAGMFPMVKEYPNIPYSRLHNRIYLYDLVYNPEKTLFLNFGSQRTSHIKNGLEMLKLQAELSWQFWNE